MRKSCHHDDQPMTGPSPHPRSRPYAECAKSVGCAAVSARSEMPYRFTLLTFLSLVSLVVGMAVPALAEDNEEAALPLYLVVPVTRNGESEAEIARIAAEAERALREQGHRTVDTEAAAEDLERRAHEPAAITPDDVELLNEESRAAERAAALKQPAEALVHVNQIRVRLEDKLETLNRDEDAARLYLRACVTEVRVHVAGGDREKALAAVRRCRDSVPGLDPRPSETPPNIMRLWTEVCEGDPPTSPLTVQVVGGKRDCSVYLRGRARGTAPFQALVSRGQQHVQVECNGDQKLGRVHSIIVDEKPVKLVIDPTFDAAVRSTGHVWLDYEHTDEVLSRKHLLRLARVLKASTVIAISKEREGEVVMRLVGAKEGRAFAVQAPFTAVTVSKTLSRLTSSAPARELADDDPIMLDEPIDAQYAAHALRRHRIELGVGGSLAALSVGSFIFSAVRFAQWRSNGSDLLLSVPDTPASIRAQRTEQNNWADDRAHLVLGATGAGVGMVGAVFLARQVPVGARRWVGPLAAAAGVGLAAVGVSQVLRSQPCEFPVQHSELARCVRQQEQRERGALWTFGALPLLTVSVTHLIAWSTRPASTSLKVHASASELRLSWDW